MPFESTDRIADALTRLRGLLLHEVPLTPEFDRLLQYFSQWPTNQRNLDLVGPPGDPLRGVFEYCLRADVQDETTSPPLSPDTIPTRMSEVLADEFSGQSAAEQDLTGKVIHPITDDVSAAGFRLVEKLGEGASSTVYAAEPMHMPGKPRLAVKMLRRSLLQTGSIGAFQEAQAGFGLRHPNLVPVHSCGKTRHHGHYVTMEFVPGTSLAEWMRTSGKTLGNRTAAEVVATIASAAFAAYTDGMELIHRDIKPANILGCQPVKGAEGCLDVAKIKLGDFGLSQLAGPGVRPGRGGGASPIVGTVGYMAPEQMTADVGHTVSAAADVFALGVTLVELVTGKRPYGESEERDIKCIAGELQSPDLTRDRVEHLRAEYTALLDPDRMTAKVRDPYLQAIARKCLQSNAEDRYPTAEALAEDLGQWLANAPADGSGYVYQWRDRLALFGRRCRRREEDFDGDKAALWAVGLTVMTAAAALIFAACAIAPLFGGDAVFWSDVGAFALCGLFLAVTAVVWVVARRRPAIDEMTGSLGVFIFIQIIFQFFVFHEHDFKLKTVIMLNMGQFLVILGINNRKGLWRSLIWAGCGSIAIGLIYVCYLHSFLPSYFGLFFVSLTYGLFAWALAKRHIWPLWKRLWGPGVQPTLNSSQPRAKLTEI